MPAPSTDIERILDGAVEAPHTCVLSDFDGTLAPIAPRPELAALPEEARTVLSSLASLPRITVGIISGRSLDDVRSRIRLPGLWLVGNHGYEMESPSGERTSTFDPGELPILARLEEDLRRRCSGIPGVHLEPKGPVLAFHVRQVSEADRFRAEEIFLECLHPLRRRLMISRGACVLEARLRGSSNKGTAVRRIRGGLPAGTLLVYAGDDLTDQDAFRAVRGRGVSVQVGAYSELADLHLPGPAAWLDLLGRLLLRLQGRRSPPPRRGRARSIE